MSNSSVRRARRGPLSIRLNDQELAILRQRANGLPLSRYVKQAALGDDAPVARRRLPPTQDHRSLGNILAALGQSRLANNLNQLAKAVNSGSLPVTVETEADLVQACRDIALIRHTLLAALGVEDNAAKQTLANIFAHAAGGSSS
ncbi:MAG: plasmid mobilization relaxosome protein MobC [Pseudomonadota bacterium]